MDYATLLRAAERGQPPPVILAHGTDIQLGDDVLTAIGRGLFREGSETAFDREVMDAREVTSDAVVRSALTLPLMTAKRLVAVRNCQALPAKGRETLAEYCANPNPRTCLLLLANETLAATRERKEHWLLGSVPSAAIVTLPVQQGRALADWLRRRAAEEELSVDDAAARMLVEWVGDDGAALLGEARKAALAGGPTNRSVGTKEVRAVVGEHRLSSVFDLTRAVERRDAAAALKKLDGLLATEEPMRLLGLLTMEVRTGWTIHEGLRRGQTADQIARAVRRPPAVVYALAATSTAASSTEWAAKMRRCWSVERRLKSGGRARAELVLLVADLCRP